MAIYRIKSRLKDEQREPTAPSTIVCTFGYSSARFVYIVPVQTQFMHVCDAIAHSSHKVYLDVDSVMLSAIKGLRL